MNVATEKLSQSISKVEDPINKIMNDTKIPSFAVLEKSIDEEEEEPKKSVDLTESYSEEESGSQDTDDSWTPLEEEEETDEDMTPQEKPSKPKNGKRPVAIESTQKYPVSEEDSVLEESDFSSPPQRKRHSNHHVPVATQKIHPKHLHLKSKSNEYYSDSIEESSSDSSPLYRLSFTVHSFLDLVSLSCMIVMAAPSQEKLFSPCSILRHCLDPPLAIMPSTDVRRE